MDVPRDARIGIIGLVFIVTYVLQERVTIRVSGWVTTRVWLGHLRNRIAHPLLGLTEIIDTIFDLELMPRDGTFFQSDGIL